MQAGEGQERGRVRAGGSHGLYPGQRDDSGAQEDTEEYNVDEEQREEHGQAVSFHIRIRRQYRVEHDPHLNQNHTTSHTDSKMANTREADLGEVVGHCDGR